MFDQQFRPPSAPALYRLRFVATHVAGETHVLLLRLFLTGQPHLFRINDDHEIPSVDMWCKYWFCFAAQQIGYLDCHPPQGLVIGVNDVPLPLYITCFCRECPHADLPKRAEKVGETNHSVNQHFNEIPQEEK
jgi:hypothetical protein